MRPRRYFCYGAVVTSIVWIAILYLYSHLDRKPLPGLPSEEDPRPPIRIESRYGKHSDVDVAEMPDQTKEGEQDLSELAIIRKPEDQKTRDDGM